MPARSRIDLQRSFEPGHGVLLVAARHGEIAHRGLNGMERRLLFQRGRELALGVAKVVDLQGLPAAIEAAPPGPGACRPVRPET